MYMRIEKSIWWVDKYEIIINFLNLKPFSYHRKLKNLVKHSTVTFFNQ